MTDLTRHLHIYFVLDRSGSMSSMASDVIGGFNRFLADQQADGTFVTFTDGQENQSREYNREGVFSLVAERQAQPAYGIADRTCSVGGSHLNSRAVKY